MGTHHPLVLSNSVRRGHILARHSSFRPLELCCEDACLRQHSRCLLNGPSRKLNLRTGPSTPPIVVGEAGTGIVPEANQ
jgi:hypothetical protein